MSIRRVLDELPETLDGTYEQTLRRIDKQKRDYAYYLFQCLVVSKRPLRVEELAELFAIQHNDENTIPTFDASFRPENPGEFVLSACSTLVAVVNVDGQKIVQFSHFSVREYLISDRIAISEHVSRFHILPRPAHALLARACLSILLQLDEHTDVDDIGNFPLAPYAAQYWVDHAQFEDVSSDIQHGMECLFDRKKPHFAAWLYLYNVDEISRIFTPTIEYARSYAVPLYLAAVCGLRGIAEHLLDAYPEDVNARGGRLMTPLHAALDKGHLSTVMLLLERGADMEFRGRRSWTPLHMASYHGYVEVVSWLIDRGVDVNVKSLWETPICLAAKRGHEEVVRLLLDHGANANYWGGDTPLYLASEGGHYNTVRLLLNHGADPNYEDIHGSTPLHLASRRGHNDIVRLLLDRGAKANTVDHHERTPLDDATEMGHNDVVQLLLDRVDRVRDYAERVRLLFDYDADDTVMIAVNHEDDDEWNPLGHSLQLDHNEIVPLLRDHDAHSDLVYQDRIGSPPL